MQRRQPLKEFGLEKDVSPYLGVLFTNQKKNALKSFPITAEESLFIAVK